MQDYIQLLPIVLLIGFLISIPINLFRRANKPTGLVILRANKTHTNRGLHFTKDKEYKFYRNGDYLLLNEDDISRDRDNYAFYNIDLSVDFVATDWYSSLVLKQIKYKW